MSLAPAADNIDSPASSDGEDGAAQANSSDQWVTRCICVNNSQVEGFMIECERCQVWQHGDCVRVDKGKVPDEYFCELCRPELHDARGLWTGGVRNQQSGKVSVNRGSASKKKKTKSRKQNAQVQNPVGSAANGAGEGSSDNVMIDVRGMSNQPDPNTPGAAQPESMPNSAEDDQKNLSREERKIVKIMQTIQMMEDRDKKRRRSGGTNATPDQLTSATKGQSADEQISKRRKSRPSSASKPAGFDISRLTMGGYDVEQLKASPALLRNLFPVSPMYLGSKIFLLQQISLVENPPNGIASAPGTPIIHHQALVKDRSSQPPPVHSEDLQKFVKKESRTFRSPSPASQPGPSNMSANSSPFSSQPVSPAVQPVVESPVKEAVIQPAASAIEEPFSENKMPVVPMTDEVLTSESVQTSLESINPKPGLATIPRLSTIPKVSVNAVRLSDNANAIPPPPAIPKAGMFNPVPIPPIPVAGSVTPLSSLSELMQTYMNAPPTEFTPPGPMDLTRFKPNPGGLVSSPSIPLVASRWNADHSGNVLQFPIPPGRYLPAMPFSRRPIAPPPSSLPSSNQQSHPS